MSASKKLLDGLKEIGIPEEQIADLADKMDKYIGEIILFNSAYNLVNTSDYDEIVTNHILDSLSAWKELVALANQIEQQQSIKFADIGSGGGLPGIPLAAAMPEFNWTLVERMDKRCAFLENCAAILGLKNVSVMKKEAEKVSPQSFDIATFRAFRPLDEKMTKTLLSLTKDGGFLAAYKAKEDSIRVEMNGIKHLVPQYKAIPLIVPGLTDKSDREKRDRNLILIKK
ncbi:MAG: 16S rRNA (guanine(527)-N(7))-methyltransferase RsmG [Treponema sp.]|nr:16S rRNA (guanine(527)-N(7))-methyltransferase RsmG [Treponema sp.]